MQQKWNSLDEGSRLTLNLLSKEIDLRNGEVKKGVIGMKQILEGVYIYIYICVYMCVYKCMSFN